jgi:hypothetical protein
VKRLAANVEVASIVDLQRLTAILDAWPERDPPEYDPEKRIFMTIPNALAAAYFVENVTRSELSTTGKLNAITGKDVASSLQFSSLLPRNTRSGNKECPAEDHQQRTT